MKTKRHENRRISGAQPPDNFSLQLRLASACIGRGQIEQALASLDGLSSVADTPRKKAKIAAMVARSQALLGRHDDALKYYQAASKHGARILMEPEYWLEPSLGEVRVLLGAQRLEDALAKANGIASLARQNQSQFDIASNPSKAHIRASGAVQIGPRPVRLNAVLTRLGSTFHNAGYMDEAEVFFQQVVTLTPNGGSRARQCLATIHLQKGQFEKAEQLARESLLMGRFQAKTIASWSVLVSARAAQKKDPMDPQVFASFVQNCSGTVSARAHLEIVSALRSRRCGTWKVIAQRWMDQHGQEDPVVRFEIGKLLLSDNKLSSGNPVDITKLATSLLSDPLITAPEAVGIAKTLAHFGLLNPLAENHITPVARMIRRRFGKDAEARALHSMALGAMLAGKYDLARPILTTQIKQGSAGSEQWGKDLWALARMEGVVGNHAAEAQHYLTAASHSGSPARFRLQGLLLWLRAAGKSGMAIDQESSKARILEVIKEIGDYRTLMDVARQLALAGANFKELSKMVAIEAETKALQEYAEALDPAEAVGILNLLARRQYYDLSRVRQMLQTWESIDDRKIDWLWSQDSRFWEYVSLIVAGYFDVGQASDGEALAVRMLAEPTVPMSGKPYIAATYGVWLVSQDRQGEAWPVFAQLIAGNPTHRLTSQAYYWCAVRSHKTGMKADALAQCGLARKCLAPRPGIHWEWSIDAKSALLLQLITGPQQKIDMSQYKDDFLMRQQRSLDHDLGSIHI